MPNPIVNRRQTGRRKITGPTYDTFESYTDGQLLNGLNAGVNGLMTWLTGYVGLNTGLGISAVDTFEEYTDGANLNGLNGGNAFGIWDSGYRAIGV